MDPNSITETSFFSNGPMINFASAIFGALLGGGLAILGSWWATRQAHKYDLKKSQREHQEELNGFYQSIKTEINVLWESYMWGMGESVEKLTEGEYVKGYYPLTQDYFVNYKANAHLIGQITDQELREKIVTVYSKANGLIDSYRLNNHFNEQHDHWAWLAAETKDPFHIQHAQAMEQCLVEYVEPIKELHNKLKESIPQLTKRLDKNISGIEK